MMTINVVYALIYFMSLTSQSEIDQADQLYNSYITKFVYGCEHLQGTIRQVSSRQFACTLPDGVIILSKPDAETLTE